MSLILDALKRAERERQAGASMLADAPAGRPAAPRRRRWRLFFIVLLVLVAAGAGWRFLMEPRQPATPVAQVPSPTPAAPAPATARPDMTPRPLLPPPATPAPAQRLAPLPGTESIESLEDLSEEPAPEPVEPPAPARQTPAPAVAAEPEAEGTTEEAVPADAPPDEPRTTAPAEADAKPLPPVLTQPAPLRKFREMPPEFRADFPALDVQVHVYEAAPPRRFLVVNGRRYKEGERLAEGPAIIEIVRDGIVLEHRGEKFLYTLNR